MDSLQLLDVGCENSGATNVFFPTACYLKFLLTAHWHLVHWWGGLQNLLDKRVKGITLPVWFHELNKVQKPRALHTAVCGIPNMYCNVLLQ